VHWSIWTAYTAPPWTLDGDIVGAGRRERGRSTGA
jgi:hypothetical protein